MKIYIGFLTDRKLRQMENRIMAAIDDLRAAITDLGTKIDAFLAVNSADIEARIAAAIEADDAGEEVDLNQLKDDVLNIANRVPPKFEPSGNG